MRLPFYGLNASIVLASLTLERSSLSHRIPLSNKFAILEPGQEKGETRLTSLVASS